jgi:hypothetical protein
LAAADLFITGGRNWRDRATTTAVWLLLAASAPSILPAAAEGAETDQPLQLERTIPLAGVGGRIDHLAIDLARQRLIVAELGNGSVDVIDLASGRNLHRFAGLQMPQGVAYIPGPDLIAAATGGDGSLHFYRAADYADAGSIELGDDADNLRLDPRSGHLIVGYGAGGLAVVDAARHAKLQDILLPAHPEAFELDPGSGRAFVNLPDATQIAVVDLAAGRQVATWSLPGRHGNFPMAFDAAVGLVAVVFRSPPTLALLDAHGGRVAETYETCADADDVFFDPRRRRIYVSCGAGSVDVFGRESGGARRLARLPTAPFARTSLFVPQLDRLFVAARAGLFGESAAILVLRPAP